MNMIKSNPFQTQVIMHLLIIIGVFLLVFGSVIFFFPQERAISEIEFQLTDGLDSMIFCAIGLILILVNLLYYRMIKNVSISQGQIIIHEKKEDRAYKWTEVEGVGRVRFFAPPIYKVRLKSSGERVFFVTESSQGKYAKINSPFVSFVIDSSEMGKEIKKIKSQYRI